MGNIIAFIFGYGPSDEPNVSLIAENGYQIIEEIGAGGFGTVYKVKHKTTEELYAMKKTDLLGIQEKDKVIEEAKNGLQLKHENVVRIYTYFTDETSHKLYQIIELCDFSLNDWFRERGKNRSYSTCALMFCEIAAGLEYIHEKRFIHRDIKPANILIRKGKCKIADFGLMTIHAFRFESLSKYYHSFGLGTPIYAAPEQMEDEHYDFKADIFPMGCIMMEFYTQLNNDYELIVALNDLRSRRISKKFFELGRNEVQKFNDAKYLVMSMTELVPSKRSSINSIINHQFFTKNQIAKNSSCTVL